MKPQLKRLTPEYQVKPFDCENADLNGFLLEEDRHAPNAKHHATELLAVTYVIEDVDADQTIAYFSLLNDKIERELTDDRVWKRMSKEIPNLKRRRSQPAVKVGRLAVSATYKQQGKQAGIHWGSRILDALKQWFTKENKTGCRFITVDALTSAVGFYKKNGFQELVTPEEGDETVLMYYDLKRFSQD